MILVELILNEFLRGNNLLVFYIIAFHSFSWLLLNFKISRVTRSLLELNLLMVLARFLLDQILKSCELRGLGTNAFGHSGWLAFLSVIIVWRRDPLKMVCCWPLWLVLLTIFLKYFLGIQLFVWELTVYLLIIYIIIVIWQRKLLNVRGHYIRCLMTQAKRLLLSVLRTYIYQIFQSATFSIFFSRSSLIVDLHPWRWPS